MLKSQLSLSIPGKTFLMGEYLALTTGPSLIVASQPYFRFHFQVGSFNETIHPESPAGMWYQKIQNHVGRVTLLLEDPFAGQGGFGASTAQFIALWLYAKALEKKTSLEMTPQLAIDCWRDYQSLFGNSGRPSGADLINQMCGGVTAWNPQTNEVQKWKWPFADLQLHLFKTSHKVKTHEHLKQMDWSRIPREDLTEAIHSALKSFTEGNSHHFLRESAKYTETLLRAGLQAPEALALMNDISRDPNVLSVRGCGALGLDVMAVYTNPRVDLDFSELGLTKIASVPEQLGACASWGWS